MFANDFDKAVWETFERNFGIKIDKRSIVDIPSKEIPDADGILGGPPCQSWSLAGAMRGINDSRGKLFYEYIRVLKDKQPKFFVAENVAGIVSRAHIGEFKKILHELENAGYNISYKLVDAADYCVPEERKRVIIVGYHKSLGKRFEFPPPNKHKVTLNEAIGDLPETVPAASKNKANENPPVPNHEYMTGGFSTIYLSRNRVRGWDIRKKGKRL